MQKGEICGSAGGRASPHKWKDPKMRKSCVLLVLREEPSVAAKTQRQGKPSSVGSYMVKPEP